jgi:hypothetical protein
MIIFMPLVVICAFGGRTLKKIRIPKLLIDVYNCTHNKCCRVILFFLTLPWNILILALSFALFLLGGAICMPFFLIQSYIDNSKRFRSYVRYWNGKQRFDTKVNEEKIVFRKPGHIKANPLA